MEESVSRDAAVSPVGDPDARAESDPADAPNAEPEADGPRPSDASSGPGGPPGSPSVDANVAPDASKPIHADGEDAGPEDDDAPNAVDGGILGGILDGGKLNGARDDGGDSVDGADVDGGQDIPPGGEPMEAGVSEACEACTELECEQQLAACADPINDGSLPGGQSGNRCLAAVECMQTPLPSGGYCTTLDGDQDTLSCVCPVGVDALACAELDPAYLTDEQFACLPILRRAAVAGSGTGEPPASMLTVMFNLVDTEMAIGDAMAVINCQILECSSCDHVMP